MIESNLFEFIYSLGEIRENTKINFFHDVFCLYCFPSGHENDLVPCSYRVLENGTCLDDVAFPPFFERRVIYFVIVSDGVSSLFLGFVLLSVDHENDRMIDASSHPSFPPLLSVIDFSFVLDLVVHHECGLLIYFFYCSWKKTLF